MIKDFLKKIDFANDGIVESISFKNFKSVEIKIIVHHYAEKKKFDVTLNLDSIYEIKMVNPPNVTSPILSGGVQIYEINEFYYIDLNPVDLEDYEPIEDLKHSEIYFVGKLLEYKIEENSEDFK